MAEIVCIRSPKFRHAAMFEDAAKTAGVEIIPFRKVVVNGSEREICAGTRYQKIDGVVVDTDKLPVAPPLLFLGDDELIPVSWTEVFDTDKL